MAYEFDFSAMDEYVKKTFTRPSWVKSRECMAYPGFATPFSSKGYLSLYAAIGAPVFKPVLAAICAVTCLMNALSQGIDAVNAALHLDGDKFMSSGQESLRSLKDTVIYSGATVFQFLYELTALITRTLATIVDLFLVGWKGASSAASACKSRLFATPQKISLTLDEDDVYLDNEGSRVAV